jgi:kynurenine 3-monooxygenase
MPAADMPEFTIVGTGLAGALMACYLGQAGRRVDLYERRPDPRGREQSRARSINLAISVRGLEALREIGLADQILTIAIPMRGRMIHPHGGSQVFQPYGADLAASIHSISRADLNLALIRAAERYETTRLHFEQKCLGFDLQEGTLEMRDEATQQLATAETRVVIGADGAYSAVRAQMQKLDRFNYSQEYLTHGYKELTMPAGPGGKHLMEQHALHIWPRHSFMMIALPNLDGSFTCTLFWPFEGPNSFAALKTAEDIHRFFRDQFPDALDLMPNLAEEYLDNPTGSLVTVRCSPWHIGGRAVLIGDAAHAVVPFLGQGMNAAFEDCSILNRCLAERAPDWEAAFGRFESLRREHTDVLADLCIANYIEMRDLVSSRAFLLRKKLDIILNKLFPRWYIPLYTLVSFTRTPYADARRRSRRQERALHLLAGLLALCLLMLILWLGT